MSTPAPTSTAHLSVKQHGTEYVVLMKKGGEWALLEGTVYASTADNAVRKAFEKLNAGKPEQAPSQATLVAVPSRSWQPVTAKVVPQRPKIEIG